MQPYVAVYKKSTATLLSRVARIKCGTRSRRSRSSSTKENPYETRDLRTKRPA